MTLADHIMAARGTVYDAGGMLSSIAASIEQAERFEMGDDLVRACMGLMQDRPSTLLKALPLCRLPFKKIWLETRGGFAEHNARDPNVAPIPALQGSLVESLSDQSGIITVCWVHKDRDSDGRVAEIAVNASPFSVYFDWSIDGSAAPLVRAMHQKLAEKARSPIIDVIVEAGERRWLAPMNESHATEFMRRRRGWANHANNPREVEALRQHEAHMLPGLSPHGVHFLRAIGPNAPPDRLVDLIRNWENDIEGEGPFVEFFLAMLNSRNCIEREPVPMLKLNRAREKRGKAPLLDYTKIKLVMSRAQARAASHRGIDRQKPGLHEVRGHFKIRKTGVYWWHDFERGDPTRPVARASYAVDR